MRHASWLLIVLATAGCDGGGGGPKRRQVETVIDGDTFDLAGGERVRIIGIDTPERSGVEECWGDQAFNALSALIGGKKVTLEYDAEREDSFGRTLAYVDVEGTDVSTYQLQNGNACVLIIPPNGQDKAAFFESLEDGAQTANLGLWAACGGCDTPAFGGGAR